MCSSDLSKHEYDPNCKYCVNNVFVKDALETKRVVSEMETILNEMQDKAYTILNETYKYPDIEAVYKTYKENEKELNNAITLQSRIRAEIASNELILKNSNDSVKDLENKIAEYHKNKEQIELNIKIQKEIVDLKRIIDSITKQFKNSESSILKSDRKRTRLNSSH